MSQHSLRDLATATIKSLRSEGLVEGEIDRSWADPLASADFDPDLLPDLYRMLEAPHTTYTFLSETAAEHSEIAKVLGSSRSAYRRWLEKVLAGEVKPQQKKLVELCVRARISPLKLVEPISPVEIRLSRVEGGTRLEWRGPNLVRELGDPQTPLSLARRLLGVPVELAALAAGYNTDRSFFAGIERGTRTIADHRLRRIERLLDFPEGTLNSLDATMKLVEQRLRSSDYVRVVIPDDLHIQATITAWGVMFESVQDPVPAGR